MKKPVVLIGVGEMGGVFARGILKMGYPVFPITRNIDVQDVLKLIPDLEAVIVAVAEKDLTPVLRTIPKQWSTQIVLLQNELLPRDWLSVGIKNPTVISVWFEKKFGQDSKVIISSPVFGPKASLIQSALASIKIPCHTLKQEKDLLSELVLKNLYILTINIAGLALGGGTVFELWNNHRLLADDVANDVLDIQEYLTSEKFDRKALMAGMLKAFEGDWQHQCMGRSAPARLQRALSQADEAGLSVKKLREIASLRLAGK